MLALPSVYRDLIVREGGAVARAHNAFLREPRDVSFAARYETPLRRFLSDKALDTMIIECRQSLCELHLSGRWEDPYYRAYDALLDQLQQADWFDLSLRAQAHQYRGSGVQIQVWILEAGS